MEDANGDVLAGALTAEANARDAIALCRALVSGGMKDVVLSPGSRNTPLVLAFDALGAKGRLRVHEVLDERAAGFFALGLARASGNAVGLCCTSGSAGAHYLPAVVEASADGVVVRLHHQ